MKIKIYQVNTERDENRVAFFGLNVFPKFQGSSDVNSGLYDSVYTGTVDCKNLEDVFRKFNTDHPTGYKARSLSVSDVVEVIESDSVKSGFYFCDSFGFKAVKFEPDKTQISELFCDGDTVNKISVLLFPVGEYPKNIEIENSLKAMQALVGGDIEEYMPFDDEVAIICNEEGKVNGLPPNRGVYGEPYPESAEGRRRLMDVVCGDFFIVYAPTDSSEYRSLPLALMTKYSEKFRYPENFFRTEEGIKAVPFKPVSKDMER